MKQKLSMYVRFDVEIEGGTSLPLCDFGIRVPYDAIKIITPMLDVENAKVVSYCTKSVEAVE